MRIEFVVKAVLLVFVVLMLSGCEYKKAKDTVDDLQAELVDLQAHVSELEKENKELRDRVVEMEGQVPDDEKSRRSLRDMLR